METTATTLGYFLLVGFAVGLAAGWWAATQRKDNNDDVINELRDEVEAAKAAHRSYEQSVTSHFANTAQLLHRMQDYYRSIYTHIASGAQELCDADVASQLDDTKLVGSAFDLADHLVDTAQPLDYAPKKNPDEAGQLSEEFGLERAFKPNVG